MRLYVLHSVLRASQPAIILNYDRKVIRKDKLRNPL